MIDKRTADSAVAAVLIAIGIAQMWGGITMDRLEIRRIHPASIPGLLPIFLGAAMVILAAIVFYVSRKSPVDGSDPDSTISRPELISFFWVAGLAAIYALGLVGQVHFWLASALFVFTFILFAEWPKLRQAETTQKLMTGGVALTIAVVVTGAISFMFERGFLVRLP